jgi:transcriptional regulator with XRE-family HTH domain
MRLGIVLRKYRAIQELSVRQLAKEIGIAFATLSRLENGMAVDADTLMKILVWLTGRADAEAR